MSAARCWSAAVTAVLLLTGCTTVEKGDSSRSLDKGESWEEQRQHARASLARYDQQAAAASRAPEVSPSAGDSGVMGYGLSIDSATVSSPGTRMTVSFTGSPGPATRECGTDYAAEPVESDKAVVIIVLEQSNGYVGPCPMIGMTRTATLNLAKPLGDRAVLTLRGEPVPVARAAGS